MSLLQGGGGQGIGGLVVEVPRNRGSGAEPPSGVLGRSPGWGSGGETQRVHYICAITSKLRGYIIYAP